MSTATLKTRLSDAVKDAMRAKASERLTTLRFLLAAVKQKEVDERRDLNDAEITAIIEKQVKQRETLALGARQRLLAFQNAKGLISPQAAAENLTGVVNKLEEQLSELSARKTALLGYLAPAAPAVVEVDLQIKAVEKQIKTEKARLTGSKDQSLNKTVEEYQRLQLEADFMQEAYKSALIGLEKGRVEATRILKKVLVLQSATLPEYPLRPRRLYNIATFLIGALLLAGLIHLLVAIVRDHRD